MFDFFNCKIFAQVSFKDERELSKIVLKHVDDGQRWAEQNARLDQARGEVHNYIFGFTYYAIQASKPNGYFINITPKWIHKAPVNLLIRSGRLYITLCLTFDVL